jgi:DNA helicase-2/ATP-dependent DNA helicase PcrA
VSDDSVRSALRSTAALVVIEAPGGCGKTHQGSEFTRDMAALVKPGRLLILTHTHAACSVFDGKTKGIGGMWK